MPGHLNTWIQRVWSEIACDINAKDKPQEQPNILLKTVVHDFWVCRRGKGANGCHHRYNKDRHALNDAIRTGLKQKMNSLNKRHKRNIYRQGRMVTRHD